MESIAILAEIADKLPTLTETAAVSTVVACLAVGAARIRFDLLMRMFSTWHPG